MPRSSNSKVDGTAPSVRRTSINELGKPWEQTRMSFAYMTRLLVLAALVSAAAHAGPVATEPPADVLLEAMVDEMDRSMSRLSFEDLPRPYFMQYVAEDRWTHSISAALGGLLDSGDNRTRVLTTRVRVGSYELDNTNAPPAYGLRVPLPLDDDYVAIRHAIWRMTDADYKRAVETLTRKIAYLKSTNIEDRPDDFTPADPVSYFDSPAHLDFDSKEWEETVKKLSATFKKHPHIQDSVVRMLAGTSTNYLVNSEGTRILVSDTGVYLEIGAATQAPEGMHLSDSLRYIGERLDQLPSADKIMADIDEMCAKLDQLAKTPKLEQYTGPVLFEPIAAGMVFEALFAHAVCARPIPLGSGGGWGDMSLEKKLGLRVLPRSFHVYDDPGPEEYEGTVLVGAYKYDDEGIPATRVSIAEKGILKNLVAGRAPTKKITKTTGHGRTAGYGDAQATTGCLYISDTLAMSPDELRQELIQAARDEGLEYGLRIAAMQPGGYGDLGPPIYAYRVFVEDGREELVRGLEFLPVETRALKRILAAGSERKAYNSLAGVPHSIICPAILMEELDLKKNVEEFDKLPILKSPALRD